VIDGTICGNGKGPVNLDPVEKNYILASKDLVALDTVAAKMMGFDPESIPYLKIAHERRLGMTDASQIEIRGTQIDDVCFGFRSRKNVVLVVDQFLRKRTGKKVNSLIFNTLLVRLAILASVMYHNYFWYYFIALKKIKSFLRSDWGRQFSRCMNLRKRNNQKLTPTHVD
jgi:hypothetical protein